MSQPDLTIPALFSVKGQIALVTGGGSGLGTMIATSLVQNGAKVYISSRKEKQLKEVTDALNKRGPGSCHYFVSDLTSRAGCEALSAHIKSKESKLDILVNNSGATWAAPWGDFPEVPGWDKIMNLNVKSIFYLTASLTPLLTKDATNLKPSRVINISSIVSIEKRVEGSILTPEPGTGFWSYSVSKAAVNHLTSIQAVALAPKHVNVNAILPGIFPSKMSAYSISKAGDKMSQHQPTGRLGTPQDIAGVALFLSSPASAHVTGAHIVVDGGQVISGLGFTEQASPKL